MQRIFISDLHLSDDTPEIEEALGILLKTESRAESWVILGDFFEVWIGDDDDAPLAYRIKELLRFLTNSGCELLIARGNRDFMLSDQFASDVGARLLADETVLQVAGEPALLLHGDTLCTDDVDYLRFRALVHAPAWREEMMQKPLWERRELAMQLRAISIDSASNKPEDIMDVNKEAVIAAMNAADVARLIHGHTHRPARHDLPAGERIVLGDWTSSQGWLLRENGLSLSLEHFPIY